MNPHIPVETEVKLRILSVDVMAPRLAELGFRLEVPAGTERSTLWDRGCALRDSGCALRVREYAGRAWLTWKGAKMEDPLLKIRPELETAVSSPGAMADILRALGYAPVLVMEKVRALWRSEELLACLDETPFGCYLELEGAPEAIQRAMARLGLGAELAERRSYPTLFLAHGAASLEPPPVPGKPIG